MKTKSLAKVYTADNFSRNKADKSVIDYVDICGDQRISLITGCKYHFTCQDVKGSEGFLFLQELANCP